jgi:hypothetical protein
MSDEKKVSAMDNVIRHTAQNEKKCQAPLLIIAQTIMEYFPIFPIFSAPPSVIMILSNN